MQRKTPIFYKLVRHNEWNRVYQTSYSFTVFTVFTVFVTLFSYCNLI